MRGLRPNPTRREDKMVARIDIKCPPRRPLLSHPRKLVRGLHPSPPRREDWMDNRIDAKPLPSRPLASHPRRMPQATALLPAPTWQLLRRRSRRPRTTTSAVEEATRAPVTRRAAPRAVE
jgi:hypothetical protein